MYHMSMKSSHGWLRAIRFFLFSLVCSLYACSPGTFQKPPTSCGKASDCPGSQICVAGQCKIVVANTETPQEGTKGPDESTTSDASVEREPTVEPAPDRTEPVAEAKPEAKPEPEPVMETKPESRPEPTVEPIPESRPEPVPESRPEPVPESRPEPVPESRPEPTPEPGPEATPDAICTNNATRSCYTGTSGCTNQGSGWSCKGVCKTGQQTCVNGAWGPCQGSVTPSSAETCGDNLDNTCDGAVNEGCPCLYLGKTTGVCGTARRDTQGNCQAPPSYATTDVCGDKLDNNCNGVVDESCPCNYLNRTAGVCSTAKTDTRGVCQKPADYDTVDKCDGKDNDCDGLIDEEFPEKGKPCTISGTKGICSTGQWTCPGGKLICLATNKPVAEVCRDKLDNNCNGVTDETCGLQIPFAIMDRSGRTIRSYATKSLGRVTTGHYRIQFTSPTYSCGSYPLFLSALTTAPVPISYACNTTYHDVFTGTPQTTTGSRTDTSFNGVLPPRVSGHVWGSVSNTSCLPLSPYTCSQANSYGGATITRPQVGVYDIRSSNCNTFARPLFVNVVSAKIEGYATIQYNGPGKCTVFTYDLKGNRANLNFSYWIPDNSSSPNTGMAWAVIDSSGKLYAHNNFGDSYSQWTVTPNTSGSTLTSISVAFPAWAKPSVVLVNAQTLTPHLVTVDPNGTSTGTVLYPRFFNGNASMPRYIAVMFVQ